MRLKEVCRLRGIEQKKLAVKIGTNESMMSKFVNYKCLPIPSMMKTLLKELGCSRVEEIYDPHEIYLQLANVNASLTKNEKVSDIYKLTVTLPKGAKKLFDEALKPLGYKSITDWVKKCYGRLEDTYREFKTNEKTSLTPGSKEVKPLNEKH